MVPIARIQRDEGFLPSASMVLVTVMMTLAAVAHRPRH